MAQDSLTEALLAREQPVMRATTQADKDRHRQAFGPTIRPSTGLEQPLPIETPKTRAFGLLNMMTDPGNWAGPMGKAAAVVPAGRIKEIIQQLTRGLSKDSATGVLGARILEPTKRFGNMDFILPSGRGLSKDPNIIHADATGRVGLRMEEVLDAGVLRKNFSGVEGAGPMSREQAQILIDNWMMELGPHRTSGLSFNTDAILKSQPFKRSTNPYLSMANLGGPQYINKPWRFSNEGRNPTSTMLYDWFNSQPLRGK